MGVDQRNYRFAPGLPPGRVEHLLTPAVLIWAASRTSGAPPRRNPAPPQSCPSAIDPAVPACCLVDRRRVVAVAIVVAVSRKRPHLPCEQLGRALGGGGASSSSSPRFPLHTSETLLKQDSTANSGHTKLRRQRPIQVGDRRPTSRPHHAPSALSLQLLSSLSHRDCSQKATASTFGRRTSGAGRRTLSGALAPRRGVSRRSRTVR